MKTDDNIKVLVAAILVALALLVTFFPITEGTLIGPPYERESPDRGFAVVELFTSEGCSGCPPADRLLASLRDEYRGRNVFFLAYHIDYWDRNGWKDSFSLAGATQRQQQYAGWLGLRVLYTPQFVVNGTSGLAGDSRWKLERMIRAALTENRVPGLILRSAVSGESVGIRYKVGNVPADTHIVVALVRKEASVSVARGENRGRLLHHAQVVVDFKSFTLVEAEQLISFTMPDDFEVGGWEAVAFLQDNRTGAVTAASKVGL